MADRFLDICGAIIGTSAYADNKQVGRDVAIRIPELTPTTVDLQAMGTMSMPIWQLLENMEGAITKIGFDEGLCAILNPLPKTYEFRWVQTVTDANGNTRNVGCKAFMHGVPSMIPGADIAIGEGPESECTLTLTSYRLVIDGKDYHNVNRLSGKCIIAGVDMSGYRNML